LRTGVRYKKLKHLHKAEGEGWMEQRDRHARAAVAVAYFVQGFCFAALLTHVSVLQKKFSFTDAELSLVLLAVPVVAGVGSVLAGVLAGRLGSAVVLRIGGPAVALAITSVGAAASREQLYGALAFVGLGLGLVDAAMNMQGVAVERRYGRPVLASFHGVWSAGGIAGGLATAGTSELGWPIVGSLGAVAVVGTLLALAVGPYELRRHEEVAAEVPEDAAAQIPWRPIVLVGTAMMLMYIADSATSNWGTVFLSKLGATTSVAALGLVAYQTCMVLGRAGADRLVRRVGPVPAVAAGALVGGVGLVIVAVAPTPTVAIAGFAVLGLGLCVVVPQSFSAAGRLDPRSTGVAIARVNLFNYIGFVIGAALIGIVAEGASLRWAFAVPAVLTLGIMALAPSFRVRPPTPTPAPAPASAPVSR
jgi:MFS family permease